METRGAGGSFWIPGDRLRVPEHRSQQKQVKESADFPVVLVV